jgi:predicted O-methyltransferase YrrM
MRINVPDRSPLRIKSLVRGVYRSVTGRPTDEELHSEFVSRCFRSKEEYERYREEFANGPARRLREEALREYQRMTGKDSLDGVGSTLAEEYYALTRNTEPETVVETGVCNGVSTLSILLALDANGSGTLYSIDYPFRADESLAEFREETFEEYGGAAIPSDKDPGWIIPDELKSRWELIIGKSQQELPRLVTRIGEMDMFVHDSEHSHPCMMFEYELAYEWLNDGGIILSDDITWNEAFSIFTDVRDPVWGRISRSLGYIRK